MKKSHKPPKLLRSIFSPTFIRVEIATFSSFRRFSYQDGKGETKGREGNKLTLSSSLLPRVFHFAIKIESYGLHSVI